MIFSFRSCDFRREVVSEYCESCSEKESMLTRVGKLTRGSCRAWLFMIISIATSLTESAAVEKQLAAQLPDFSAEVRPRLVQHCFRCHGPQQQKAALRLDTLDPGFDAESAETWHDVLNRISVGDMPPEGEPELATNDREILTAWLRGNIDRVLRDRNGQRQETVLRRLTRYEYNNTLRDLLGINFDFAADLPPEANSADGFRNNGSVLGISPLQIEYYLKAARLAMDKAIVTGPPPQVYSQRFESPSGNTRQQENVTGRRLPPHGRFPATIQQYPRTGEFIVRVKAGAEIPAGMGNPRLLLTMGLRSDTESPTKPIGEIDIRASVAQPQVYEFRGRMESFPLPGHNPKFPGVTISAINVYDDGLGVIRPPKYKPIRFNDAQRMLVQEAVKKNVHQFPVIAGQRASKLEQQISGQLRKLQVRLEEQRLISPEDSNRTDLAYRMFDIHRGVAAEAEQMQKLAEQQQPDDPQQYLDAYRLLNANLLADRQQILDRFDGVEPIDRRTKRMAEPLEPVPERSTIVLDYLEFEGPIYETWPPESHTALLPPSEQPEPQRAREAIAALMQRAWRRPVTANEVDSIVSFYEEIRPQAASFEEAMRECFAMVLIAPEFLYLVERKDVESKRLSDYELASRLSYFLWSTLPDEELLSLAAMGRLSDVQQLETQVLRMLHDDRSSEFVQHFTNQWLHLPGIDRVAINPEYYPDFDDGLKSQMRQQTQAFFAEVLHNNESALNFIDSEFTMLNEPLARHYGLQLPEGGPRGADFERVELPAGSDRGGLLTQGSVLLLNSTGEDSHPIRRAVWLLDRILGSPPPPPPPDVPELNTEEAELATLPLKQQLELHRTREACNDCHRAIDPWGVAFESFDAVGRRRDTVLRKRGKQRLQSAVDDVAELPNGKVITGVRELQQHLLSSERDRFAETLVRKLLAYALGRSLVLPDQPVIEELVEEFRGQDYRLRDLVVAIVSSEVFGSR